MDTTTATPWYATAPRDGFTSTCWQRWETELRFSRGARLVDGSVPNTVLDHDSKRGTLGRQSKRPRFGVLR